MTWENNMASAFLSLLYRTLTPGCTNHRSGMGKQHGVRVSESTLPHINTVQITVVTVTWENNMASAFLSLLYRTLTPGCTNHRSDMAGKTTRRMRF